MTTTAPASLADQQHLVLEGVSWGFYEHALDEVGDRPIFITFDHGRMEVMAPLPEHELEKKAIGSLLELLSVELRIEMRPFGSTTFRREDAQVGVEPDECYYLHNEPKVRRMQRFDPSVHPAPDLAIEVEITHRSVPRLPVYAGLGVPEVWRYDGTTITIMVLNSAGDYEPTANSLAFPFLPIVDFQRFVERLRGDEDRIAVIDDFREWVKQLPR
jgi:Uma2 family endonuclease